MKPVYSALTKRHFPLRLLSANELAVRLANNSRQTTRIGVTLYDPAGHVRYRNVVVIPQWMRAESLREEITRPDESNIDGHKIALGRDIFVVRVPAIAGAKLSLDFNLLANSKTLDLDLLVHSAPLLPSEPAAVGFPRTLPGWEKGDPANRVDLLIMGDGYTATQEAKFENDALSVANSLFEITPYHEYRNYVNVTTLFTPSAQAGADQPPYDPSCTQYARAQACCGDSQADGKGSSLVYTAFDATFCSFNIQRALTVDVGKVFAAAAAAPDWDVVLVIVNDAKSGGSGGLVSTISTHPFAVYVAQHEYAHTFTALADEYADPYPDFPSCSDVDATIPRCERNVTDETDRSLIKCQRWVASFMPIPSDGPPLVATDAGLWEGARYLSASMYRQGYDCMMRSLFRPFCDVASDAYALRLYEGGWGNPAAGIDIIEPGSEDPPPGIIAVPGSCAFKATLVGPADEAALHVEWRMNGQVVSVSKSVSGETVSYAFNEPPGVYTVDLTVVDSSSIIHPTVQRDFERTRTWQVVVTGSTTSTSTSTTTTMGPTPVTTPISTTSSTTSTTPTTVTNSTTTTFIDTTPVTTLSVSTSSTTSTTSSATTTSTTLPGAEVCDNCVDDDGNGLIDGADPTCPRASASGQGVRDRKGRGKAIVKCQEALAKAGAKFVEKKLRRLRKCVDAVFDCVQRKAGDAVCMAKVRARCRKEIGSLWKNEADFRGRVSRRCGGVPLDDIVDDSGLGYGAYSNRRCSSELQSLGDVVECMLGGSECTAEKLFGMEVPRAGALLVCGGRRPDKEFPCLGGSVLACSGSVHVPGRAVAKEVVKCQKAVEKAASKFVAAELKAYGECAKVVFKCVQLRQPERRPGDYARCLAKAVRRCGRGVGKLGATPRGAEAKLRSVILKRCGRVGVADLLGPAGLSFGEVTDECADLGVGGLWTLGDVAKCIIAHHRCRARHILEGEVPRLGELLEIGGVQK